MSKKAFRKIKRAIFESPGLNPLGTILLPLNFGRKKVVFRIGMDVACVFNNYSLSISPTSDHACPQLWDAHYQTQSGRTLLD